MAFQDIHRLPLTVKFTEVTLRGTMYSVPCAQVFCQKTDRQRAIENKRS
jgi:hypothetical protein